MNDAVIGSNIFNGIASLVIGLFLTIAGGIDWFNGNDSIWVPLFGLALIASAFSWFSEAGKNIDKQEQQRNGKDV